MDARPVAAPDGGWGWMIVAATFTNGVVLAGFSVMISVLYVEWSQHFQTGAGEMSWIGFLFPGTAGLASIIIGFIWTKIGVRRTALIGSFLGVVGCFTASFCEEPYQLALTVGLVSGLGVGLSYISTLNMMAIYFHKRYGVASGICFLGTSAGQIGLPPFIRTLVSFYGWRGTLQLFSAILAHNIAAACLLRPLKARLPKRRHKACDTRDIETHDFETQLSELGKTGGDDISIYASSLQIAQTQNTRLTRTFCQILADMFGITLFRTEPLAILLTVASIVGVIGFFPSFAHLIAMAEESGISSKQSVILLSIVGAGGSVGRVLSGVIADRHFIGPHRLTVVCNLVAGVPIGLLPVIMRTGSYAWISVTSFFIGVGIGGIMVVRMVQAKKVVRPALMPDVIRIVVMTAGVGRTVGAVLSGFLHDVTGNYSVSFYFAADVLLLAAALNFTLSVLTRRRRRRHERQQAAARLMDSNA